MLGMEGGTWLLPRVFIATTHGPKVFFTKLFNRLRAGIEFSLQGLAHLLGGKGFVFALV
jgi:hypothetical protein